MIDTDSDSVVWIGKRRKQKPSKRKGSRKIGGGRVTVRGCHSGRLKPWTCLVLLLLPVVVVLGAGSSSRTSAIVRTVLEFPLPLHALAGKRLRCVWIAIKLQGYNRP
ncbi:hypothetical protein IF2G_05590 [Cordyceps javanica]|nr:hypothetical protein IF2G_05590 [Cordyceps javanica]